MIDCPVLYHNNKECGAGGRLVDGWMGWIDGWMVKPGVVCGCSVLFFFIFFSSSSSQVLFWFAPLLARK